MTERKSSSDETWGQSQVPEYQLWHLTLTTRQPDLAELARLQSKFQNQINQFIPGYYIIVIRIEPLEYIAAKIKTLLIQQALCQGNKLAS